MDQMLGQLADTLNSAEHNFEDCQWENAEVVDGAVLVMLDGESIRITMERF